ncbi:hypothetical protein Scep_004344 [Stephania cephalantha]|uniref:Uncharacterized protein n=1 Tax=Stephania cephalantha TaxID=152367 RepID=A0AAP0KUU6_9MAGN
MTDQREASSAGWKAALSAGSRRFAPVGQDHQPAAARPKATKSHLKVRMTGGRRRQPASGGGRRATTGASPAGTMSHLKLPTTGGLRTTEGGRPIFKSSDGIWSRSRSSEIRNVTTDLKEMAAWGAWSA